MALKIIPHDTKIDFIGFRFITFAISVTIIIATLWASFYKGINYGIDFKGGLILEIQTKEERDIGELREKIESLKLGDVSIQNFGGPKDLLIRVEQKDEASENQTQSISQIKQALGTDVEYRRVSTVGPKVGDELVQNALKAIAFSLLAMLIYIAVRFEWQFAACAIIALFHDCVAILGLFSVFSFEFNETSIIAILITAGYSINDTIVIFDRIRENMRKYKKMELKELINKSINETLSRTILTASTTLLALLALYLFGGKVISTFSMPILVGIIIGSFSSICLAAPLLLYLKVKKRPEEASVPAA